MSDTVVYKPSMLPVFNLFMALRQASETLHELGEVGALATANVLAGDVERILNDHRIHIFDLGKQEAPTLAEHREARKRRDLEQIENGHWPLWPLLAVKRTSGSLCEQKLELGVIADGHGPVVRSCSPIASLDVALASDVVAEYESFEEMLADGWMVD